MTGYRFLKVDYENFGPFGKAEVGLSFPGLTVVEGQIDGKRGCDSNGAGKSFLFDGVAWALYGRCIRAKYKGDDVIRLGSKGGCAVRVYIDGPHDILIARYRKHPEFGNDVRLHVDGKDQSRGTNPQTTVAIERLLGMDFTCFCNSIAFGVRDDVRSFFSATDTDRKKVMERLLGLERYAEAEKVARRKLHKVMEKLDTLSSERIVAEATRAEKSRALSDLREASHMRDSELEYKQAQLRVKRLAAKLKDAEKKLAAVSAAVVPLEDLFEQKQVAHVKAERAYLKAEAEQDRKVRTVEQDVAVVESNLKTLNIRITKLKSKGGKKCPACEQVISKTHVAKLLPALAEEATTGAAELKSLKGNLKTLKADQLGGVPEPPEPSDELDDAREAVTDAMDGLKHHQSQVDMAEARAEELKKAYVNTEAQENSLHNGIKEADKELKALEDKAVALHAKVDYYEFWVEGFGNRGLKSFLIEAEIPAINRLASGYARLLLGEGAVVKLSATQTLKTKDAIREKLAVVGTIPGCTKSYAGASQGQKKRMDLSLLLAFRDLVSSRAGKPLNQLFADELFDGLDKTGTESVSELLRDLSADCPVALVTHDSRIKPLADRVVLVHHDGKMATVTQQEAYPTHDVPASKPPKKVKKKVKRKKIVKKKV